MGKFLLHSLVTYAFIIDINNINLLVWKRPGILHTLGQ